MDFSYKDYYRGLVQVPAFFIIVSMFFIITMLFVGYINIKNKTINWKLVLLLFVFISGASFTLVSKTQQINIHFHQDKNSTPETIIGVIENIDEQQQKIRGYYNGDAEFSKTVTISGEEYHIMYIGDFEIGDEVTVEYLPTSKVIMSIRLE